MCKAATPDGDCRVVCGISVWRGFGWILLCRSSLWECMPVWKVRAARLMCVVRGLWPLLGNYNWWRSSGGQC